MKLPADHVNVMFKGKEYLLMSDGAVRVVKTARGTHPFRAKWSEPDSKIAKGVLAAWLAVSAKPSQS